MNNSFKTLILATLLLGSIFSCTKFFSGGGGGASEIIIGEYGSLTGGEATFGLSTNKGVRLALDEVNEKGGIKGKKIKLITYDDQGKTEEAASTVTRLITKDKAVAILGEVASSRSKAAAPIAQSNKIPMISPSSTNPDVTKVGNFIFRVCFIDPFQGLVMAKFASEHLKVKKAAILRDVKSDYSVGLADVFVTEFKKMGGEIVADLSYQGQQDIDFKAQLTEIRGKDPEIIFIPGYYTEVGMIAQQARQLGIKAALLGGDGWDSPKLHEIGKEAINGAYFSNHYTTESTDPATVEFIKKYKAKYNETPDGLSALGYDAARILSEAISRSDLTSVSIRDEIAKTKEFVGATGKITINENRDAVKSAVVVRVEGPDRKYVTTVTP